MAVRRRPEPDAPTRGPAAVIIATAREIVARGEPLSQSDFHALEAVQQVDSFEHLVLTMCQLTPEQEADYHRHCVEAGYWRAGR